MRTLFCLLALVAVCSAGKILRALTGERAGDCPAPSGLDGFCVFNPNVNCLSDSECPLAGEKAGQCPASSGLAGICIFDPNVNCLSDSECPSAQKCCSEGCGKVCKDPATTLVLAEHAGACPPIEPGHEIGICMLLPNSCSADSQCSATEKCCPEGCNRVCKHAIQTIG